VLDELPLPGIGCQVLDNWRIPALKQFPAVHIQVEHGENKALWILMITEVCRAVQCGAMHE